MCVYKKKQKVYINMERVIARATETKKECSVSASYVYISR